MRYSLCSLLVVLLGFSTLALAEPTPRILVPNIPKIQSDAYVLEDFQTGRIIASKRMDKRMPPASLTKMMTLFVISDALKRQRIHLDDKVLISKNAWQTGGSRMFVKVGSRVSVRDLLQGIIVQSGNDACVALSEHTAGSEDAFVSLMNQTAKTLGMTHSHFTDSTGLNHPEHYSTPRDMAILARALIMNFPKYYTWYKQKWFKYNGIKQPNRNRLLWRDPTVDGVKTGHTSKAGYCLVASAHRSGMRLISVLMKAPSDGVRTNESQKLLTYGFRFYETARVYKANQPITTSRVWMGTSKTVTFGLPHDAYVMMPRGDLKNVKMNIALPTPLKAPIGVGHHYGRLNITLHGQNIAHFPLIALTNVNEAGFWTRLLDRILLSLKHFFDDKANANTP